MPKEEWLLLHTVPSMVGVAVLGVDDSGLWGSTKETFSLSKAWVKGISQYEQNSLIHDLLSEKTDPEGAPIKEGYDDLKENLKQQGVEGFMAEIVAECGRAADLLDQKSTPQEAAEYKNWVMTIGRKVAAAAKEKDSGGSRVSPKEEALLEEVASALRLDTPA